MSDQQELYNKYSEAMRNFMRQTDPALIEGLEKDIKSMRRDRKTELFFQPLLFIGLMAAIFLYKNGEATFMYGIFFAFNLMFFLCSIFHAASLKTKIKRATGFLQKMKDGEFHLGSF